MATLGPCHLCGITSKLTFEHVPPKAAFNDRPIVVKLGRHIVSATSAADARGARSRREPRGAGGYTLCESCNNDTGAWYGRQYVEWAYQAVEISDRAAVAPSLAQRFQIYPLRVIKQIACMFFSANPPSFQVDQQDTVRFVLNRERRYMDPSFRVFAYLNRSPVSRQAAATTRVQTGVRPSSKTYSEISYPPLGYVLSIAGEPPDAAMCDISFFSTYGYNEWTDVWLRLPVLAVESPYPGDYRPEAEVFSPTADPVRVYDTAGGGLKRLR